MFSNNYLYTNLNIYPTSFVAYPVFQHQYSKRNNTSFKVQSSSSSAQSYLGNITTKNKIKIIRAVNLLYDISSTQHYINPTTKKKNSFKLNFITLTLSSAQLLVGDKLIKKECFEWWLGVARRKFNLKSYVWKLERQKNGNLHYHITTNCYIDNKKLRDSWNLAQNRIGFIDLFEQRYNHRNPNSTDIKSVKSTKNLAVYIAKYLSKELDSKDRISGKLWDCSEDLKSVSVCSALLDFNNDLSLQKILDNNSFKKIDKDYISIFVLMKDRVKNVLVDNLKESYETYLQKVRNYKRVSNDVASSLDNRKQNEKENNKAEYQHQKFRIKESSRLPTQQQLDFIINRVGRV